MFKCGHSAKTISTCLFQSSPPHKEQSCQHQGESQNISIQLVCRSTPDLELLLLCKCWCWHIVSRVLYDSLGIELPINSPRGWHRSSHSLTSASLIKDYFNDITKTKTMKPWTRGCVLGCPQELPGCRKVWRKMRPWQKYYAEMKLGQTWTDLNLQNLMICSDSNLAEDHVAVAVTVKGRTQAVLAFCHCLQLNFLSSKTQIA